MKQSPRFLVAVSLGALLVGLASCGGVSGRADVEIPLSGLKQAKQMSIADSLTSAPGFDVDLPGGSKQGKGGRWVAVDLHLVVDLEPAVSEGGITAVSAPSTQLIAAVDGSYFVEAEFAKSVGTSRFHLENVDLLNGSVSRDLAIGKNDLHVGNFLQDASVSGGRRHIALFVRQSRSPGAPQIRAVVVEPDSHAIITSKSPYPLHIVGTNLQRLHIGQDARIEFIVLADDNRVAGPIELKAIASDPTVRIVGAPLLEVGGPGVRSRRGSVVLRATQPGQFKVVLAARSSVNSPYWPVTLEVSQ